MIFLILISNARQSSDDKGDWQTKKASKWRPPVIGLVGLSEKTRLLGVDFYFSQNLYL